MKTPVILLLTKDNELEDSVADSLSEIGGVSHLTRDPGDALEIICSVHVRRIESKSAPLCCASKHEGKTSR